MIWATDYIEQRLNLNNILMPNPANMIRVDTPEGFVLVDRSLAAKPGDTVAFQFDDYPQLEKLFSSDIITSDGEIIDGEGLQEIIVQGKVTAEIVAVHEPFRPTM